MYRHYIIGALAIFVSTDASVEDAVGELLPGCQVVDIASNYSVRINTASASECADDGTRIDVLLIYTQRARIEAGGLEPLMRLARRFQDHTNIAFRASGVSTAVRVSLGPEINYDERDLPGGFTEPLVVHSQRLFDPGDGYIDEVHRLRNSVHADVVSLLVGSSPVAACGVAVSDGSELVRDDLAFHVVLSFCADIGHPQRDVFTHELGHNLGNCHNPTMGCPAYYSYSKAYIDPNGLFRTIMSIPIQDGYGQPDISPIPHFSNPAIDF